MQERSTIYLAGVEKARTIAVDQAGEYPQLIVRTIDRLAPAIASLIESESDACPHCLALALENFLVSPALAALTLGFSERTKGTALRAIVDIKCAALGFECINVTDATPSSQAGGLH